MQGKIFLVFYLIAIIITASVGIYLSVYTRESLAFGYCEFNKEYMHISFSYENLGYIDTTIVDLLVNFVSVVPADYGIIDIVPAGERSLLGCPYNWSSGQKYTITLVTVRGSYFSHTETAVDAQTLLDIENVCWNSQFNTTSIVIRNTGVRTREIVGLGIFKTAYWILPVTDRTNLDEGKLLPIDQTITVTLGWPNAFASQWTKGETYHFYVRTETGTCKEFNCTVPL